jgi:NADH-quinone oxidoreductase subunit M
MNVLAAVLNSSVLSSVFSSVHVAEQAAHSATSVPFPLLTMLILVPMIGAAVVALIPKTRHEIVTTLGLGVSGATLALAVWLMTNFDKAEAGYQFGSKHQWISQFGVSWNLGVDGISLWLVVLTGILFPIAIFGPDERHERKNYVAWLLLLEAGVMGVFLSLDLFMFFVFFEIVLVPMYFLIGGWGHGNKTYSALKFFLYTMFGSALMLVASITLVALAKPKLGMYTFDITQLAEAGLGQTTARWLFLAFALAFSIKVPIFPLHTWLPDAHTDSPTAGSVILAGVMLKMGTYGLIRFGLFLFPEASSWFGPVMLTLGVIGIIYGALTAVVQKDLKRLVAYSSVAHLGFIVVGTYAMTQQALSGSVLQMINHGVSTPALFLLVGWIYERRHTREIAELRGLQKMAPVFAGVFTIVMLSSIGVPGLNGFVGEFMILIGTFLTHRWWAVVAASGVILAALYLLWAYQRTFHGEPDAGDSMEDLNFREKLAIAPLLILIVFMGVYPKPFLDRIDPSVKALITHIEDKTSVREPEVAKLRGVIEEGAEGELPGVVVVDGESAGEGTAEKPAKHEAGKAHK